MAVAVIMPRQGNTVESCIITAWNKKPGDTVAVGDVLFPMKPIKRHSNAKRKRRVRS